MERECHPFAKLNIRALSSFFRRGVSVDESELMKFLEKNIHCDFNEFNHFFGVTGFHLLCRSGSARAVRFVLDKTKIEVNNKACCSTPLVSSIEAKNFEVSELLSEIDEVVEEAKKEKDMIFRIACFHGCISWVKLLSTLPDLNINDLMYNMRTPLQMAFEHDYFRIVEILIGIPGIDVHNKLGDHRKRTPLHFICQERNDESNVTNIARLLLEDERVDLNITDSNGESPFYSCLTRNNNMAIKELLRYNGVDLGTLLGFKFEHKHLQWGMANMEKSVAITLLASTYGPKILNHLYCAPVLNLDARDLASLCVRDPKGMFRKLKNETGLAAENFASLYSLVNLLKEGLIVLSRCDDKPPEWKRFFAITGIMPDELVMLTSKLASDSDPMFVDQKIYRETISYLFSYFCRKSKRLSRK